MLEHFRPEELQFLEVEMREFKVMDGLYLEAQATNTKNKQPLESYDDYWIRKGFEKAQIKIFREALAEGIELPRIAQPAHTRLMLKNLVLLIKSGVKVKQWLHATAKQIGLIAKIAAADNDLAKSLTNAFTEKQLETISKHAEAGEDCRILLDPNLTTQQMNVLIKAVKDGVYDANSMINKTAEEIEADIMEAKMAKLETELTGVPVSILTLVASGDEHGVDLRSYLNQRYNKDQLAVILKGLIDKVDISPIADPSLEAPDMAFLYRDLSLGRDVSYYNQANIALPLRKAVRDAMLEGDWTNSILVALTPSLDRDQREEIVTAYKERDIARIAAEKAARKEKSKQDTKTTQTEVVETPAKTRANKITAFDNVPTKQESVPVEMPVKQESASNKVSNAQEFLSNIPLISEKPTVVATGSVKGIAAQAALTALSNEGNEQLKAYIQQEGNTLNQSAGWMDKLAEYTKREQKDLKTLENPVFIRLQYLNRMAQQGPDYPDTETELQAYIQEEINFLLNIGLPYKRVRAIVGLMGRRLNYYPLVTWITAKAFDEMYAEIVANAIKSE